ALTPPNEVRKSLKRYARQAEKRAAQASELPALLGELAGLQAQTLAVQDSSEKRADGLLQRLFGHGQRTLAEQVAEAPVPQVAEPHAERTETVQVVCATTRRDDSDWSLLLDQLPMPAALFDEPEPAAPQEAEEQPAADAAPDERSEEHTSELQSRENLVCRLLLEKKKNKHHTDFKS